MFSMFQVRKLINPIAVLNDKRTRTHGDIVFFIVFRETLETSIVVSILLAFLKTQLGPDADPAVYKRLRNQVWNCIAQKISCTANK